MNRYYFILGIGVALIAISLIFWPHQAPQTHSNQLPPWKVEPTTTMTARP